MTGRGRSRAARRPGFASLKAIVLVSLVRTKMISDLRSPTHREATSSFVASMPGELHVKIVHHRKGVQLQALAQFPPPAPTDDRHTARMHQSGRSFLESVPAQEKVHAAARCPEI